MSKKRTTRLALATVFTASLVATSLAPATAFEPAAPAQVHSQGITTAAVPSTDVASFVPTARKLQRGAGRIDVFVSKSYPLSPARYVPKTKTLKGTSIRLRPEAADAYLKMKTAAKKSGVNIALVSGYRSYDRQAQLFRQYTQQYGSKDAQRISAKPGTSEHQTGLAVDVGNTNHQCGLQACFESTKVGRWMAKNAHKYGFILRYPKGYESVTGYAYEPWHFRYVGTSLAKSYTRSGARTLEHYYGVAKAKPKAGKPKTQAPKGTSSAETKANLNLHSGVGTKHKVLLTIPKGKKISLTGKTSKGWYQVKYASKTGWVSGTYLGSFSGSKPKTQTSPSKPKSSAKTKKTTANLNLRTKAGTGNKILLTIPKGKKVSLTGKTSKGWYQVKYSSKTGWVSGKYLR